MSAAWQLVWLSIQARPRWFPSLSNPQRNIRKQHANCMQSKMSMGEKTLQIEIVTRRVIRTKPVTTRAEQLAADLSKDIVDGTLAPGARLDEHVLASRFGVSRTPVREALKRLAGLDLVEIRPHRGAVVVDMPATRISELFEALAEAEATCARLAAIKMSILDRERLSTLHEAFCALPDGSEPVRVATCNRSFHEAIYAGCHNGFLSDHVATLRKRLAPYTAAQFRLRSRPFDSAREHTRIVDAILARDGTGAADAARRHVMAVGHAWASWAQANMESDRERIGSSDTISPAMEHTV
ncbi:GntR family transcriptional regulator [Methylobacterium sp.]|uniref:GntR family transcriptional regulator n=1 Tax=Methylobacterium sp. TaxID=409 RepID=UPI003B01F91E